MHNHMSHFSLKSLFGAVFLFFAFSFGLKAQDGAKIFKQNCAVCHSLTDQKLTGPGLLGVADRVPKPVDEWLAKWIKNNKKVIASGDAYAKALLAANDNKEMTTFESGIVVNAKPEWILYRASTKEVLKRGTFK